MANDIHLDYDALWKAVPAGPIEAMAQKIAENVDTGGVTDAHVEVMMGETQFGAPVALVTIAHPAGLAMQAKHGSLTKAAAAEGLTVTSTADKVRVTLKSGRGKWITTKQATAHAARAAK